MDIADDWNQQFNLDLYIQTYDAAIRFAKDYPETLWCYGNHDVLFMHGGLTESFVREYVKPGYYHDVDKVVEKINIFGCGEMWIGAVVQWTTLRSRSTDRVGRREIHLSGTGHSIIKGGCINPESSYRLWGIHP